jgi:hypothetical protein
VRTCAGIIRSAAGLCLIAFVLAAQESGPDSDRREAQALWEQMIAAKGGRDKLNSVRSIEQTGHRKLYKLPGRWWVKKTSETQLVRVFVVPDRMWQWADEGATVLGLHLNVCNLSRDLEYFTGRGEPVIKHGAVCGGQLWEAQLVYLNESADVHPEPVRLMQRKELPRNMDAIETKVNIYGYFRIGFYLDKHTHLPVRIVVWQHLRNFPDAQTSYELGDYQEIDGVMIPCAVIRTNNWYSLELGLSSSPQRFLPQ